MKDREIILRDLLTSPSTADAIKDHTGLPADTIATILADEEIAGTIESRTIKGRIMSLVVWHLTQAGKDIAKHIPHVPAFH